MRFSTSVWSMKAAAWATGSMLIYMKKKVKFSINMKALTKGLISTAVMALSVYIIMQFKLPNTVGLILEISCGVIAYTAVNLVMKNTLIFEIVNKVKGKISHKA